MHILIANDDGYLAPGIRALARVLGQHHQITVCAPEQNASGTSNALTLHRPLQVWQDDLGHHVLNGTPADCVHVALTGLCGSRPDVVVSGINNGANLGEDTLYSGTVGAAMEGYLFGVPALAFSQVERGWHGLDAAADLALHWVTQLSGRIASVKVGQERPFLLNVNLPAGATVSTPTEWVRLGRRHASSGVIRQVSPRGDDLYWIGPAGAAADAGEGTDFGAIARGHVSVTPLQIDLTDHGALAQREPG